MSIAEDFAISRSGNAIPLARRDTAMAFLRKITQSLMEKLGRVEAENQMRPEIKEAFNATWRADIESMEYLADR